MAFGWQQIQNKQYYRSVENEVCLIIPIGNSICLYLGKKKIFA
jgi:hypothetical protein